jgi:hypothetical protein
LFNRYTTKENDGYEVQKILIIAVVLLLSGCTSRTVSPRASRYDVIIENLSRTTDQLDSIRCEKGFFVKVWNDSEDQRADFAELMFNRSGQYDAEAFAKWHEDIAAREEQISRQHALNVLFAHIKAGQMTCDNPNRLPGSNDQ